MGPFRLFALIFLLTMNRRLLKKKQQYFVNGFSFKSSKVTELKENALEKLKASNKFYGLFSEQRKRGPNFFQQVHGIRGFYIWVTRSVQVK